MIDELNGIIRARNYNAWEGFLSDSYLREINSPEFLEARTEELYRLDLLRSQGQTVQKRILGSARDYFNNIVVPSRQNARVDDIDFISETRVKAYTIERGNRLRLYDLEIINGTWKIIN